tara:strand:+ start:831 stop:992 length:162 start_codon:yes stop_codon:yes gene_type:complete
MSCEHNERLLELYFDEAKRNGLSNIDAEAYAHMMLEHEGHPPANVMQQFMESL